MSRRTTLAACLVLAMLPFCAKAKTTKAEIQARLVGRPLYLRGQWSKDKLEFDESGNLMGSSPTNSFTVAGVDIKSVDLKDDELDLHGQRAGLEFTNDAPSRVVLKKGFAEKITIRIHAYTGADYSAALDAILTEDVSKLDPPIPWFWLKFARKHLFTSGTGSAKDDEDAAQPGLHKMDAAVTVPVLDKTTFKTPRFSAAAIGLRYTGISTIHMVLGSDGVPAKVSILHPVGLGLDEAAVDTVSQYRFKPAMVDGKPVPIEMNVEIKFDLY